MAVNKGKNIWVFDTAGQSIVASIGYTFPVYIKYIQYDTADATADGQFEVLDKVGGQKLVPSYDYTLAGNEPPAPFPVETFVDGLYIESIPAGGKILVYHGRV